MWLPDKNVRPIGFLKSLHSSPPPRWDGAGTAGILRHFRKLHLLKPTDFSAQEGMSFFL
jgi:hypothetical protein